MPSDINQATKTLWLIPARGGSKGIPRKNIRPFCGKSLVARAITQAIECAAPHDEILVSTDSQEIIIEAEEHGAPTSYRRPDSLATDTAGTYEVICDALEFFREKGVGFEKLILLQPTSPLRTVEDIKGADALWKPGIDMVVSVAPAKTNPYYNGFELNPQGYLHVSKGEGNFKRRQDAPPVWEYNGVVYVMSVASLEKESYLKFKKIIPFYMPAERSIDLDDETDWIIAETIYKKLNS